MIHGESAEMKHKQISQDPILNKKSRRKKSKKRSSVITAGNLGRRGHAAAADEIAVTTRLLRRPSAAGNDRQPIKELSPRAPSDELGGTIHVYNPDAFRLLCDLGLDDNESEDTLATETAREQEEETAGNVTVANAELLLQLLSADEPLSGPASHAHGRAINKNKNKNDTHARAAFSIARDEHRRSASGGVAGARAAANAQCKGPIQRRVSSSGGKFGRRLRLAQLAAFQDQDTAGRDVARRAHTR